MPPNLNQRILAFTTHNDGISNVLKNSVGISEAFDHNNPPAHLPKILQWDAIWDTGATNSVITQEVVDALGLKPITKVKVNSAHGTKLVDAYLVRVCLVNNLQFPRVQVTLGELAGVSVLIGMDIMLAGDFAVSNYEGKTTFSFRFPSCGNIDFVRDLKNFQAAREQKKLPATTNDQKRKDKNKRKQARKDRRSR